MHRSMGRIQVLMAASLVKDEAIGDVLFEAYESPYQSGPGLHRARLTPRHSRGGPTLYRSGRRNGRGVNRSTSARGLAQKTFIVSSSAKTANLVKLGGNFLIASVIESLGEAMALIGKGGVDRRRYLDILTSTLFSGPRLQDIRRANHGRKI